MGSNRLAGDALYVAEIVGIVAFALSGAMLAIRKNFDLVGIVVLAAMTALGGGVMRDVIIGFTPPTSFRHVEYLLVPIATALIAMVTHTWIERIERPILLFDAAGLALFTVNGTLIARDANLSPIAAAILGIVTGVGGGLLRDVIARDVPLLVRRDSELYAIPAAVGALIVAFAHRLDVYNVAVAVTAMLLVFVLRVAAMSFGWHAPGARRVG